MRQALPVVAVLGTAALVAYLEVRKLPKGGRIIVEDEFGNPVEYTTEESWRYSTWERVKTWLLGRLPGGE